MDISLPRRLSAEFIAAALLVIAGCGAIMTDTLRDGALGAVGIAAVFGLIITVLVYSTGRISGAHINPAVTMALALTGRFPLKEAPAYIGAQIAGATVGAGVLLFTLGDVSRLGSTLPSGTVAQSFALEVVLTFILMFVIMAVATEVGHTEVLAPVAIGATVGLDALFGGPISGASMNPARSIGPALVSGTLDHLWLYVVAPMIGALLAVPAYAVTAGKSVIHKDPVPDGHHENAPSDHDSRVR